MSFQNHLDEGNTLTGEMLSSYLLYSVQSVPSTTPAIILESAVKAYMGDWVTKDGWTIKRKISKRSDWERFLRDVEELQIGLKIKE